MRYFAFLLLALCLALNGAEAGMLPLYGGFGAPVAAPAFACDGSGSGVCADHSAGQTFVQWPDARVAGVCDAATGTYCTNYATRYRIMRSLAPITSGNFGAATVIGSYDLPNSGQLIGGNPDVAAGSSFLKAHRQADDTTNVMAKIPDAHLGGLKTLSYATGLQVYTALGSANAYYAVIQTNTSDAAPVFFGSVGPIAESVAPQQAIQYAHRTTGAGRLTPFASPPAVVFGAHASLTGGGGAAGSANSVSGDYYQWFGDTTEGWQDGLQRVFLVRKDGVAATFYPSLIADTGDLIFNSMDNIWNSIGDAAGVVGFETFWSGLGLTPNLLVGAANRFYPITENSIKKQITWLNTQYGADLHKLYWTGPSMGAFGGVLTGMHMKSPLDATKPMFAAIMVAHPIFRWDLAQWQSYWPGGGTFWGGTVGSPWPFAATVANGPNTLGTTASALLNSDGSSWIAQRDAATYYAAAPGDDLPFLGWMDAKDDTNLPGSTGPGLQSVGSWRQIIEAADALETAHRGYATNWYMGLHDTGSSGFGTIWCDWTSGTFAITQGCYNFSQFRLDRAYIAFDHSSINDNMGTGTRDANGIYDGDIVGVRNAGFVWNVTSDTVGAFNFTVGNNWMGRSPTTIPASTITGTVPSSGAASVGITSTAGFLAVGANQYFRIGNEAVRASSFAASTLTITARALFGTTAQAHSAGEALTQLVAQATGPNGGPYATMTANMTPRFVQAFKPSGAPTCTYTPSGGSPTAASVTYLGNHVFTLTGIPIAVGVLTSVACS